MTSQATPNSAKVRRLSPDTRKEIALAVMSGEKTPDMIAREFQVSHRTINDALRRAAEGQFEDAPKTGRPKKLSNEDEERLIRMYESSNGDERSIRKTKLAFVADGGPSVCTTTVNRILQKAGCIPLQPEDIQLKPGLNRTFNQLSDGLRRFEAIKQTADSIRTSLNNVIGGESDKTANEEMSEILKESSATDGLDEEIAKTFVSASGLFARLGEEERTYFRHLESDCIHPLESISRNSELIANASGDRDLKTVTEEMFVAKRKLRNAKTNRDHYREQANIATQKFEAVKDAITSTTAKISEHQDQQREAVKAFLKNQKDFYLRAAAAIDEAFPNL